MLAISLYSNKFRWEWHVLQCFLFLPTNKNLVHLLASVLCKLPYWGLHGQKACTTLVFCATNEWGGESDHV